jgi:hypothetical protein
MAIDAAVPSLLGNPDQAPCWPGSFSSRFIFASQKGYANDGEFGGVATYAYYILVIPFRLRTSTAISSGGENPKMNSRKRCVEMRSGHAKGWLPSQSCGVTKTVFASGFQSLVEFNRVQEARWRLVGVSFMHPCKQTTKIGEISHAF